MDISRLANLAEILGVLIVVGGIGFAVVQLRQTRQQRRELAAIELFRSFGNPQFAEAFRSVLDLPEGLSRKELRATYPDAEIHAMLIATTMENIGVMTYQRIVPFLVVKNLVGSCTGLLWRKLGTWTNDLRGEYDDATTFEWFQWLAMQLDENGGTGKRPAYEAFNGWRPLRPSEEM